MPFLRRLGAPSESRPDSNGAKLYDSAWTGKGVTLPAGTELRMEYRGREHLGVIENAAWVVESRRFKSPSAAAGARGRYQERQPTEPGRLEVLAGQASQRCRLEQPCYAAVALNLCNPPLRDL
ncbi:MAG TPA: hypothetical protein VGX71_00755 [Pseudaminobacter sp.]|nr:hypothetical protein [Pseudaminobacter sp.]